MNFKQFLCEGGAATEQWDTHRVSADDIKTAMSFVAKTLNVSESDIENRLLGSTPLTLAGKKDSSGDIDLAFKDDASKDDLVKKMMNAVKQRGRFFAGTNVASFAVPVKKGKVQVDFIFGPDTKWTKFAYHSSEGADSKYSGTLRNVLLAAIAHLKNEEGKDFVLKDENDTIYARASRSYKLSTGLERLFKLAPMRKDGKGRNKSLATVTPDELEKELKRLGKNIKFDKNADAVSDPDTVAKLLFGTGVKASDIMTAENIIDVMKKVFTKSECAEVFKAAKDTFRKHRKDLFNKALPPEIENA